MNRLKSTYVSLFITVASIVAIHGLFTLFREPSWTWAFATAAGLAAAGFFGFIFLFPLARTSPNLWRQTGLIAVFAVLAVALHLRDGQRLPAAYALAVLGGWILYVFWYSRFAQRQGSELQIGKPLPEFSLEDELGRPVSSHSLRGYAAILIFYRGNWCPFCTAQIQELANQYREIEAAGARVVLISPQSQGRTQALARKISAPLRFWVDVGNRVARQLGIAAEAGTPLGLQVLGYASDTVMPTVIITDADGKILFADLTDNYRVRPEPATYLEILGASEATSRS